MQTLTDWVTLPSAAKRWGVTRGWVHRLVADGRVSAEVVARAGDRWMLDPKFVESVGELVDQGRPIHEAIDLATR